MKKFVCLLLVILLVLPTAAFASDVTALSAADALSVMGLFRGTPDGYELERAPTRNEALVMLIRLLGQEEAARSGEWTQPFTDLSPWASAYVGYAYQFGLTKGRSGTTFDGSAPVSASEYVVFLLRALGYGDGDFQYSAAARFAGDLGLDLSGIDGVFTRGDAAELSLSALTLNAKNGGTLLDSLLASGAVTAAQARASGVQNGGKTAYTPTEIYRMASNAVFYIALYSTTDYYTSNVPEKGGSGFFISSDGLAVTNYHVISDMRFARVILSDGRIFPLTGVVWYDVDKDIAVVQVSRASSEGVSVDSFPYLALGPKPSVGQTVYALGSPLGLTGSFSAGIVSYISREMSGYDYIQFDAAISSGSSGGVLLNEYCEAVAITSASYTSGQNLNLGAPVSLLAGVDLDGDYETLGSVSKREAEHSSSTLAVNLTPSSDRIVISAGEERLLTIRTDSTVSDASLTWESSDESVALCAWTSRVFSNAVNLKIVGLKAGSADVTITYVNSRGTVIGSCVIHVAVTPEAPASAS